MRCLLFGGMLLGLTACGGGAGSIVLGPPADPTPNPNATYSISGKIEIAAGVLVDDDINDKNATHCSYSLGVGEKCQNDTYLQVIADSRSIVQGFASAVGSGGDSSLERFYAEADLVDRYLIHLKANETLRLHVVDFEHGDLDLYASVATKVDGYWQYAEDAIYRSENEHTEDEPNSGQIESITVADDATYFIEVSAFAGISKYVLQVIPALPEAAVSTAANVVADEMVVKYKPAAISTSRVARYAEADIQAQLVPIPKAAALRASAKTATSQAVTMQEQNPEFFAKLNTLKEIKRLQVSTEVEYAEPNYIRTLQALPNDPAYSVQWHYSAINLPQAWDLSTGYRDHAVIVAVLDTGVFLAHPELSSKLVTGYDFVASKPGGDDPGDNKDPGKSSWHGTHVAGTIAAASNNGTGIAGVSWGAKVMPVRVLGQGGGTSFNVAQGIRYAAGLSNSSGTVPVQKADIINLSLGSTSSSSAERDALAAAIGAGVLVVAAAGNNGKNESFYPAAYDQVIGVGATRFNGNKASYSNMGTHVDVVAPGGQTAEDLNSDRNPDGVYSTFVNDSSGTRVAAYAWMQGTSMAAPHVAGVLALMKAVNPDLTQSDVEAMITSCSITARRNSCSRDNNVGYGQLDAYLAVQQANELSSVELPAVLVPAKSAVTLKPVGNSSSAIETLRIHNYGGVAATTLSLSKTQTWLTLTAELPSSLNKDQSFALVLTAATTGLSTGSYRDTITLSYHNGSEQKSLTIAVVLVVGDIGYSSTLTQHYVLLEDADCDPDTSEQSCIVGYDEPISLMSGSSPYANFRLTGVKPGNYRIYAGTDIDVDNLICQDGETCAVYPVAGQPLRLESNLAGANITVRLNGADRVQAMGLKRSAKRIESENGKGLVR